MRYNYRMKLMAADLSLVKEKYGVLIGEITYISPKIYIRGQLCYSFSVDIYAIKYRSISNKRKYRYLMRPSKGQKYGILSCTLTLPYYHNYTDIHTELLHRKIKFYGVFKLLKRGKTYRTCKYVMTNIQKMEYKTQNEDEVKQLHGQTISR